MTTFIITFLVLLVVMLGMAIGAMRGRPIKGSCGGLNSPDGECSICGATAKCDGDEAQQQAAQLQTEAYQPKK